MDTKKQQIREGLLSNQVDEDRIAEHEGGSDNEDWFSEPDGCIDIPMLKNELDESQKLKPIDVYLKHCNEFSAQGLAVIKKQLKPYYWQPADFQNNFMNPNISKYVQDQIVLPLKINQNSNMFDVHECDSSGSGSEFGQNIQKEQTSKIQNTMNSQWRKKIPLIFETQSQYMQYIYPERHNIHIMIKNYGIYINTGTTEKLIETKTCKVQSTSKGKRGTSQYVNQKTPFVSQSSLKQKLTPLLQDDQSLTLDSAPEKLNESDKHGHIIIKSIKIYKPDLDIVKEILVEEITSYKNNFKNDLKDNASYDTSTLTMNDTLYYFKRIYNNINNAASYLQLYKCELNNKFKEQKVVTKSGKEYIFYEDKYCDKLCRKQFNSIFSKTNSKVTCSKMHNQTEEQFLNSQYVVFQMYEGIASAHLKSLSVDDPHSIYQVYSLNDLNKQIELPRTNRTAALPGIFEEQIMFMVHLENKQDSIHSNSLTKFLIASKFNMTIYEDLCGDNGNYTQQIVFNHNFSYEQPLSPIQIQESTFNTYYSVDTHEQLQHCFIIDSQNNIQLIYPQYEGRIQQQKIRQQISQTSGILIYKCEEYKRIQKYSNQDDKIANIFQKLDHLKMILPQEIDISKLNDEYNYGEDCSNQFLSILNLNNENNSKQFLTVVQLCNCNVNLCMDQSTLNASILKKGSAAKLLFSVQSLIKQKTRLIVENKYNHKKSQQLENQISNEITQQFDELFNDNYTRRQIKLVRTQHQIQEPGNYQMFYQQKPVTVVSTILNEKLSKIGAKREMRLNVNLQIVQHTWSRTVTIIIFQIVVNLMDKPAKRGYFILQKSNDDMIKVLDGNQKIIQDENLTVDLIDGIDKKGEVKIKSLSLDNLSEYIIKPDFKETKLTFTSFQESQMNNFIPFVYQEKDNITNNRLFVYNCFDSKFCTPEQINPTLPNQKYMITDQYGFNCYMFTLSSDILPKHDNDKLDLKYAKFSLFTLFQDKLGRIQVQDFMIQNNRLKIIVQLIGQKQIFMSNKLIETCNYSDILNSQAVPFYHDDKIKGCQLILNKGKQLAQETDIINNPLQIIQKTSKIQNNIACINLLDEDINNLYKYSSSVVFFGNTTFELDSKDSHQNAQVISAKLRQSYIDDKVFSNDEAFVILRKTTDRALSMRVPDLRYLLLNNFDEIKSKNFFQSQEILNGKSICDICINDPYSISIAIENWEKIDKNPSGSIIEKICSSDKVRKEIFQEVGFYSDTLIINQDFSFCTTIARGIEQNSIKSLMVILDYIFTYVNSDSYNGMIMTDLPLILQSSKIEISEFFSRSSNDSNKYSLVQDLCNMETLFDDVDLPVFSDQQYEYVCLSKLKNPNNMLDEIKSIIQKRDESKSDDVSKNYEVEHFYINFTRIVIGEKIRMHQMNIEEGTKEKFCLHNMQLAEYLSRDDDNMDFYQQETVQRLIDWQWQKTQVFMQAVLGMYVILFFVPYIIIILNPENSSLNKLMLIICCFPQYILFSIELTQMWKDGLSYFQGWNLTDFAMFVVFQTFVQLKFAGIDDSTGIFPELKLLIFLMAFAKIMFFVRIFENIGFLINMVKYCLEDLIPFILTFITLLFVFTICFIVLQMEIDPEVAEAKGLTFFQKAILQTFRTSIGELGMPTYTKILLQPDGFQKSMNIGLIWMIWYIQTFTMLVIMLNFIIAVITATYGRVVTKQKPISYQNKADLNLEFFELFQLLGFFPEQINLLIFSSTLEGSGLEEDPVSKATTEIKNHIQKQNKLLTRNHSTIIHNSEAMKTGQLRLQSQMKEQFNQIETQITQLCNEVKSLQDQ